VTVYLVDTSIIIKRDDEGSVARQMKDILANFSWPKIG